MGNMSGRMQNAHAIKSQVELEPTCGCHGPSRSIVGVFVPLGSHLVAIMNVLVPSWSVLGTFQRLRDGFDDRLTFLIRFMGALWLQQTAMLTLPVGFYINLQHYY